MNIVTADLAYHQQDTPDNCGHALIQMMLRSAGQPMASLRQDAIGLSISNCGSEAGWSGTSPDALVCVMNAGRPHDLARNFIICVDTVPDDACSRIATTIISTNLAVPAIVMGNKHWVAVRGVAFDDPRESGLPSTIRGFYFNSPAPVTARIQHPTDPRAASFPNPLPHIDGDACGLGSIFGTACEYATSYGWLQDFWSRPCSIYAGYLTVSNVPQPPIGESRFVVGPPLPTVGPIVSMHEAAAAAEYELRNNPAATAGPLAKRLANPRAIAAPNPIAGLQRDYYVVRVECDGGAANVSIDRSNGALRGFQSPAGTSIPDTYNDEAALSALQRQSSAFRHLFDAKSLRQSHVAFDPALFWKPCRQTRSPFTPIAKVYVHGNTLFLIDGCIYESLDEESSG